MSSLISGSRSEMETKVELVTKGYKDTAVVWGVEEVTQ